MNVHLVMMVKKAFSDQKYSFTQRKKPMRIEIPLESTYVVFINLTVVKGLGMRFQRVLIKVVLLWSVRRWSFVQLYYPGFHRVSRFMLATMGRA